MSKRTHKMRHKDSEKYSSRQIYGHFFFLHSVLFAQRTRDVECDWIIFFFSSTGVIEMKLRANFKGKSFYLTQFHIAISSFVSHIAHFAHKKKSFHTLPHAEPKQRTEFLRCHYYLSFVYSPLVRKSLCILCVCVQTIVPYDGNWL